MRFSEQVIQQVWQKARAMADRDADEWRHDQCGAWIKRDAYESEHSDYGWTIRNISPGNSGATESLYPFHHQNGYEVALGKPQCRMTADRAGIPPTGHIDHPRNKPV